MGLTCSYIVMPRLALLLGLAFLGVACAASSDDDDGAVSEANLGTCAQATTSSAVNLRNAATTDSAILVTLDPGAAVDVIDSGSATGWAHVRANGQDGYIKATLLTCAATAKPSMVAPQGEATIDGVIDPIWQSVPATTFDTDWSGKTTPSKTTVRAMWSSHALTMLWVVEGTGLNTDPSKPISAERENLYNEDCVEIFFTPNPAEPKKYFEIELGPYGHYFDLSIDRKNNKSDEAWSSGAQIKTTVDKARHTAIIEVALTSPDIVSALKSGATLPINMFRMEGKGTREYLAWSPTRTPRPNFHVPEAFGSLVLE